MDLSTATPVEIDTALSEIYQRFYKQQDETAKIRKWLRDYSEGLRKKVDQPMMYASYTEEGRVSLEQRYEASLEAEQVIVNESLPYESEFRRRPWTRFFLVQNNGGHIHSSMHCSTCYPTTRFGWLPALSGQTEAEAVAAHGAILCTVCYPSAPVEWTDRRDDSVCAGSGRYVDRDLPNRVGFHSGNWGECPVCHERVTVTKGMKYRKHGKK